MMFNNHNRCISFKY